MHEVSILLCNAVHDLQPQCVQFCKMVVKKMLNCTRYQKETQGNFLLKSPVLKKCSHLVHKYSSCAILSHGQWTQVLLFSRNANCRKKKCSYPVLEYCSWTMELGHTSCLSFESVLKINVHEFNINQCHNYKSLFLLKIYHIPQWDLDL